MRTKYNVSRCEVKVLSTLWVKPQASLMKSCSQIQIPDNASLKLEIFIKNVWVLSQSC